MSQAIPVLWLMLEPGEDRWQVWCADADRTMRLCKVVENPLSLGQIVFPMIRALGELEDALLLKLKAEPDRREGRHCAICKRPIVRHIACCICGTLWRTARAAALCARRHYLGK